MDPRNSEVLEAVSHFVERLRRSGLRVDAVYLYGSHATGTAHRDSDIDVAVISSDFTGDWLEDQHKVAVARLQSDVRIEPVRFRPEQFREENPLAWEIKQTGIRIA